MPDPRRHDVDLVSLPRRRFSPGRAVLRRVAFALALLFFVALVVRIGRTGWVDGAGGEISFLDALYYASVTTTTTGYGDITAVSSGARLATVVLIMPARILFLILVVGTTVEVLTEQSRRKLLARRWRQTVRDHYVICGFGSTGSSAALDLCSRGVPADQIVVVDHSREVIEDAVHRGFVGVLGDATQNAVLEQAAIAEARAVIVTPNRDDTAVLITLTVRELNPTAHIVASGREQENLHLLTQGGADEVIDTTAAVGRLLGLATQAPRAVDVVHDLIDAGTGLDLVEVDPAGPAERPSVPEGAMLIGIVRGGERVRTSEVHPDRLRPGDRLVVVRETPRR